MGDFGAILGRIKSYAFKRFFEESFRGFFGGIFGIVWVFLSVILGQFINRITLSLNAPHNYNKFGLAKRPVLRML